MAFPFFLVFLFPEGSAISWDFGIYPQSETGRFLLAEILPYSLKNIPHYGIYSE